MPKSSQRGEGRVGSTPARKLQKLIANIPLESTNNTIGRQGPQQSPRAAPHSSMGLLDLNGSSVTHAVTPQNYKKISRAKRGKKNAPICSRSSSYFEESDDTQSQQSCNTKLAIPYHYSNQPNVPNHYPSMPAQLIAQETLAIHPPIRCPIGPSLPSLLQFDNGTNPMLHSSFYQESTLPPPQPVQESVQQASVQLPHLDPFLDASLIYSSSTMQPTSLPLSFDWSESNLDSQSHSNYEWENPNSSQPLYDFSSYDGYPILSPSASPWPSFGQQSPDCPTENLPIYSQFLDSGLHSNISQIQQPYYEDYDRF